MSLVTPEDVCAAAQRLESVLEPTPIEESRALSAVLGDEVVLKCENLQRTGSFKLRGAYNRIARLSAEDKRGGVVCASAGNHAQGVALAARMQDVEAIVFMPHQAPLPKVEATSSYGAEVRFVGNSVDEALGAAQTFAAKHDRVFVHPFDHPDIIAGQGTVGLELLDQLDRIGTVLIPVGGGGLLSGVAVALKAARPDIRVVGVQADGAASFSASLDAGSPQALSQLDTIADGIAIKQPGELTLAHVRKFADEMVTVDDATTARAVVLLLERAKLIVEPSGAVGAAVILGGDDVLLTSPVVVLLSGGNIDPLVLQHLVTSGLSAEGRYLTVRTRVPDRPAELARLLALLGDARGNVIGIEHHRLGRRLKLGEVEVVIELETRGHEHILELRRILADAGYPVATS